METTSNITDMRDSFSKTHPLVSFLFFAAAITFSFLLTQPVCVAIGLLCALANALYLNGKKAVSLIPGIFSIVLGVVFVLLPARSAAFVYRITGGMLLIKVIGEYFVMIRNREVLSSVKDTIQQIKDQ